MLNDRAYDELKEIVSSIGWKILVERISLIKERADKQFHLSKDEREFRINKGRYDMADEILSLLKFPQDIVDDGVKVMQFSPDVTGASSTRIKENL